MVLAGIHHQTLDTAAAGTWLWGWERPVTPLQPLDFCIPRSVSWRRRCIHPEAYSSTRQWLRSFTKRSGLASCLEGQELTRGGEMCSRSRSRPQEHPQRGDITQQDPHGPTEGCARSCSAHPGLTPTPLPPVLGSLRGGCPVPTPARELWVLRAQATPPLHPRAGKPCKPVGFGAGGEKQEQGAAGAAGAAGCPGVGRVAGAAGHCQVTSAGARKSDSRCIRSAVLQFQFHRLTIIFRLLLVAH